MQKCNVKTSKKCAFCKYWYDPANSHIAPVLPRYGQWEFDSKAKERCMLTNSRFMLANQFCSKFECKI